MSEQTPYVITISRQLGSGGEYIGQRIATRLGIHYADREIVQQAAQMLDVSETIVEPIDERMTPAWQSLFNIFDQGRPELCFVSPKNLQPHDDDFHAAESSIITQIASTWSAVIIGRGGYYLLRNNPRHLAVFFYADMDFRSRRVQEICKVSPKEAAKMIEDSDRDRKHYLSSMTGTDWADARQYHLSLDIGALGFPLAEQMIVDGLASLLKNAPMY